MRRQRAKKPPEEVLWGIVSHPKYRRDHELAPVTLLQSPKPHFRRFSGSGQVPRSRNAVQALAAWLGIALLFLPSYSAELNLIERPWKVTKRRALYGRHHPTCRDFQAAIPEVLDALPTKYSQQPVSWITRIFLQFDDVSLMAPQGITRISFEPSTKPRSTRAGMALVPRRPW